jgi:hypothetical protein
LRRSKKVATGEGRIVDWDFSLAIPAKSLTRESLRPGEMRWSPKQMIYYPYRATGIIVEALVPRACGKSTGGWHNRLYNITRNL